MKLFKPDHEPEKKCVDHINRDRTDNRLENLRWVTVQDNNRNRSNSYKVQCLETLEIFNSCWEAADKYGCGSYDISNAINPKHNQKTAAGLHWKKYKENDND